MYGFCSCDGNPEYGKKKCYENLSGRSVLEYKTIRDRRILIRSTVMAGELMSYIVAADGTTNAQEGCFDDTVIEAALAIQADIRTPRKTMYQKVVQVRMQR